MRNNEIKMVALNDEALENVVGGFTNCDPFKMEYVDRVFEKVPVLKPIWEALRKWF